MINQILPEDHTGACLKELSLTKKSFMIDQILPEDHTGACLKELSLTKKLFVINQIPQKNHTGAFFNFQALIDRATLGKRAERYAS